MACAARAQSAPDTTTIGKHAHSTIAVDHLVIILRLAHKDPFIQQLGLH
jgi:hypothetical protein